MNSEKKLAMHPPNTTLCLATVTTDAFVPGTFVLIHSFLKAHPWFQGDIVIIHDSLEQGLQKDFTTCFDRVHFISISSRLKDRLQDLLACHPELLARMARFYSLELFRLRGYDKILYCDSDILFCKPTTELFLAEQPLICCGDGAHYRGNGRHITSFAEIYESAQNAIKPNATDMLSQTFNAGFLLIDALLLNEQTYRDLLALLSIETWQSLEADHTDQVLYNLYFAGQQTQVSAIYNYLLMHRAAIYASEGIKLAEASVLHFNGPAKPWEFKHTLSATQQDAALIQALKFWYDAYIECLKFMHFKGITSKI